MEDAERGAVLGSVGAHIADGMIHDDVMYNITSTHAPFVINHQNVSKSHTISSLFVRGWGGKLTLRNANFFIEEWKIREITVV